MLGVLKIILSFAVLILKKIKQMKKLNDCIMRNEYYKYRLEPGSKKHYCPQCEQKSFVRYIDTDTKEYINDEVGRCDRLDNCSYHCPPREYFKDNRIKIRKEKTIRQNGDKFVFEFQFDRETKDAVKKLQGTKFDWDKKRWYIKTDKLQKEIVQFADTWGFTIREQPKPKPADYISPGEMRANTDKSALAYDHFTQHLYRNFKESTVNKLIERYYIRSAKKIKHATVFPQIDASGRIRTAKIILYKEDSFNRTDKISWVHNWLNRKEFALKQCFFGLHQIRCERVLKNPGRFSISIVESEKTAVVLKGFEIESGIRDNIWLAAGQLNGLNIDKMKPLKDFSIRLYPDLSASGNAYNTWQKKAKEFRSKGFDVYVSTTLEKEATAEQKRQGWDLADFILKGSKICKNYKLKRDAPKKPKNDTTKALKYH